MPKSTVFLSSSPYAAFVAADSRFRSTASGASAACEKPAHRWPSAFSSESPGSSWFRLAASEVERGPLPLAHTCRPLQISGGSNHSAKVFPDKRPARRAEPSTAPPSGVPPAVASRNRLEGCRFPHQAIGHPRPETGIAHRWCGRCGVGTWRMDRARTPAR